MKEEIITWRKNTGLSFIDRLDDDILKFALQLSPTRFNQISMEDFDKILLAFSNYYTYLQSELGILISRVEFLQEKLDNAVSLKASGYSAHSAGERRAIAISRDEGLSRLQESVRTERTKLEMLRPVNEAIRQKLYMMSRIFERRTKNEH